MMQHTERSQQFSGTDFTHDTQIRRDTHEMHRNPPPGAGGLKPDFRSVFLTELQSGRPSTLPIQLYVIGAYEHWLKCETPFKRETLWDFVRCMTGHKELMDGTAMAAWKRVDAEVRKWRSASAIRTMGVSMQTFDDWGYWFGIDRVAAQAYFLKAWESVRYRPGHSPLDNAVAHAKKCGVTLSDSVRAKRPEEYATFIAIAAWLQVAMGDTTILLPCQKVGDLMGMTKMTISIYRRWAVDDGYLVITKAHNRGAGESTEFRFNLSRFKGIEEKSQQATQLRETA